jgi:hypothetical protein
MVMKKIYGKKREIVGKSATHVMQEDEKLQFFHDVAERAGCGASEEKHERYINKKLNTEIKKAKIQF